MSIRHLFAALAISMGLAAGACLPDAVTKTLQTVGKCSGPGIGDLFTTVQQLLKQDGSGELSTEVADELARIGTTHGPGVVKCLVEEFIFRARSAPSASADPAQLLAADRGDAFLSGYGQ